MSIHSSSPSTCRHICLDHAICREIDKISRDILICLGIFYHGQASGFHVSVALRQDSSGSQGSSRSAMTWISSSARLVQRPSVAPRPFLVGYFNIKDLAPCYDHKGTGTGFPHLAKTGRSADSIPGQSLVGQQLARPPTTTYSSKILFLQRNTQPAILRKQLYSPVIFTSKDGLCRSCLRRVSNRGTN